MTRVVSTCLRLLLMLALGWSGVAAAQGGALAATVAPVTRDTAARPAPEVAAPPAAVPPMAAQDAPAACHAPATRPPAAHAAPAHAGHLHAGHATGAGTSGHGCCKGGVCACTCAAPAFVALLYLPTPVPLAAAPVALRQDYRPSHLLPQPYRPPIA